MKSPAFSFYVRDWLCSKTVSKLHSKAYSKDGSNPCSRGLNAYLFLLCEAWLEDGIPHLPDNDDDLAALARVTPLEWSHIKESVMVKFQRDANGILVNDRQFEEWKKQQLRKQSGSKGGSKGVANRVANRVAALEDANAIEKAVGSVPDSGESSHAMFINKLLALYKRRADEALTYAEQSAVAGIIRERPNRIDELRILETLKDREPKYFPQSLSRLVNNWQEALDRARNWTQNAPKPPAENPRNFGMPSTGRQAGERAVAELKARGDIK